jgi:hypothetical protein
MQARHEKGSWLDAFAVGASFLCLIHCLVLPLVFALMPAASSLFGMPAWFHLAAFAMAVPASGIAMTRGYRLHGACLPLILGSAGLVFLGIGALSGFRVAAETGITVVGSVLLAIGHLRNWKMQQIVARGNAPLVLANPPCESP